MGTYDNKYAVATTADVMWGIYQFAAVGGAQTAVTIATDADFADAPAVSGDGANYGTPSDATFFGNNSYIVLNVGSGQYKIIRVSTTVLQVQAAMDRNGTGWKNKNFDVANQALTVATAWNDASAPAGCTLYCCSDDTFTDGGSVARPAAIFAIRDPLGAEGSQFLEGIYVGDYVPLDYTNDDKPACMLARKMGQNTTTQAWGYNTNGANLLSRSAAEFNHSTKDLTANGYVSIWYPNISARIVSNSGDGTQWADDPVLIHRGATSQRLGILNPNIVTGGADARTDGNKDGTGNWMVMGEFMVYQTVV